MATPTISYDYIDQSIMATCLILPKDIDSFYNPITQSHTGFAWDGTLYSDGIQVLNDTSPPTPIYASWYNESANPYRGDTNTFPQAGLVLLSRVALTILDETTAALSLWMQFLLQDNFALANNFNDELNGWLPTGLAYADGILSVIYSPDAGSHMGLLTSPPTSPPFFTSPPYYDVDSNMVVSIDFSQDQIYLDVAV